MGKHQKAERRHPEAKHGQKAKKPATDQQRAGDDAPCAGSRERQLETTEHEFSTVSVDAVFPLADHSKPFGFMEKRAERHIPKDGAREKLCKLVTFFFKKPLGKSNGHLY